MPWFNTYTCEQLGIPFITTEQALAALQPGGTLADLPHFRKLARVPEEVENAEV